MKKILIYLFTALVALPSFAAEQRNPDDIFPLLDLMATSIAIVESDYVDDINVTNIIYGALHGMLKSLDPHSEFMEPAEANELKIDTAGEFGGIGIEIGMRDSYPLVIAPIEDTPAFEAGLLPKDKIIKIEGDSARNLTLTKIIKKLRGEPGTEVKITIQRERNGMREIKDVELTRAIIKTKKIRDVVMIDKTNGIGYIRMIGFDKPSPVDLRNGIESLVTQGMVSLIFDLRNNGGGLLKSAIDISELFLSPDQIIVSTKGRIPGQDNVYRAKSSKKNYEMPLVILVNGSSASASEIVTGAIKDHKRGVIIGSKTYGKGSVQSVLPIGNGKCSLRLTTAKYYTPSGVCIHGTGIYPNVEVEISLEDEIRLIQKHSRAFKNMDLDNATEKEKKEYEKIKKVEDVQLDRAVDLLKAMRFISGDKFISLFESKPAVIVRDEKKIETADFETNKFSK